MNNGKKISERQSTKSFYDDFGEEILTQGELLSSLGGIEEDGLLEEIVASERYHPCINKAVNVAIPLRKKYFSLFLFWVFRPFLSSKYRKA